MKIHRKDGTPRNSNVTFIKECAECIPTKVPMMVKGLTLIDFEYYQIFTLSLSLSLEDAGRSIVVRQTSANSSRVLMLHIRRVRINLQCPIPENNGP